MTQKTCKQCGKPFTPARPLQAVCSPTCAHRKVKADKAAEKKADKAKKDSFVRLSVLMKRADDVFQAWVKERDRQAGYDCISSGRPLQWGTVHCHGGHFRSKGAASHLRYNPDNCHAQSAHDNKWKAGNASEYRVRLIERIGLERVEALENNNEVHHWTREEVLGIRQEYADKLKALRKDRKD